MLDIGCYPQAMDLTDSHLKCFPESTRERYEFYETRNASAILSATNPVRFQEIIEVLNALLCGHPTSLFQAAMKQNWLED